MSRLPRFEAAVLEHRLVAIVRGVPTDRLEALVAVLADSGVRLIEVALSDEGALEQVSVLRTAAPDEVLVGAGTVTSADLAKAARDRGAEFLVTPHVEPGVIDFANENDLGLACGALTPTEIALARSHGARFIKLFPAAVMGPEYVKALLGPFPDLELLVVGGVDSTNFSEYLRAGALGAGVGGALAGRGDHDPDASVRREAEALVELCRG